MVSTAAYGTWPSPIDAALPPRTTAGPEFVGTVGDEVWWTEPRPAEGGRRALVRRRADGATESVLPAPWNPRSRVIEYGGEPVGRAPREEGGPLVVFVHFADQRLYAYAPDGPDEPWPLTPVSDARRRAALGGPASCTSTRGEVWCVLEEFTGDAPTDVRRVIAAVPLDGSAAGGPGRRARTHRRPEPVRHRAQALARRPPGGLDRLGPSADAVGRHRRDDRRGDRRRATSPASRPLVGDVEESVVQVEWDRDGSLVFVSDLGGWWELQRHQARRRGRRGRCPAAGSAPAASEEFGGPLWKIGLRWFRLLDNGLIAVIHGRGTTALGVLDPETGELVDAGGPLDRVGRDPRRRRHPGHRDRRRAPTPRTRWSSWTPPPGTPGRSAPPHQDAVDPAYYPEPQIRTFTGPGGREIHAHVYPPHHPDRTGTRGRAAAVRDLGARRPHQPCPARARPGDRLLHLPRHRRRRGRTTAARPATAAPTASGCANSGASWTWRTARPSPWRWPTRARPTATGSPSAAAARAAGRPPPRSPPTDVLRLRHDQLPDPRPGGLGDRRDPRLRVAVPGVARRPVRRGARALPRALARPPRRPDHRALPAAPGAGRRDLPARPVRALPRRDRGPRGAARLPRLRGGGPRLPPRRHHHPRPGGRTLPVRADVRLRPARRARRWS